MERRTVSFISQGQSCRGWLYVPEGGGPERPRPGIVMAHGFSGVKEMFLPDYAERFCGAGFVVLVFDYRFLGESEGQPRGQILPEEQIEDYRNALSWLSLQAEVDPARLAVWGTSYSGGHVLHLAAFDRRVKAVVAQVPGVGAWPFLLESLGPEVVHGICARMAEDRLKRYRTQTETFLPVVAPPGQPAALGAPDAQDFFEQQTPGADSTWINQVTVRSMERLIEYHPADAVELIAPTPLLLVAAERDALIPLAAVRKVFERAGEPKRLVVLPCRHFEVYPDGPFRRQALDEETAWFKTHLLKDVPESV
jgi:hypothetical protein